jgi:cholesterol transport system auxiliary component
MIRSSWLESAEFLGLFTSSVIRGKRMGHTPRVHRAFLLALLFHLASGCTIFPEPSNQPVTSYLLTFDASPAQAWPSCASSVGTLLVNLPREHNGGNSNGIAYLLRPHELRYYSYNQWADSPARLLLPLLVQAMEQTHCWGTVAQAAVAVHGDYRLETTILQWQQEFFPSPSRVRITLRAQLIDIQKLDVAMARRFETVEEAPSSDAYGAVLASNRAINRLLGDIAEWIKTNPPREGS